MQRDLKSLKENKFDLLIIGAGIHGACAARDAALRGLRVAVIDKGDFGSATSHNSLKTIHGGIRYLQQLNIKRTLQSIREQAIFLKIAPHLVTRLDFLMPLYGWGMRGPIAMWLALNFFYSLCRLQRSPVTRGKLLSANNIRNNFPDFPAADLTGGAQWPEVQITCADRAILEILEDVYRNNGTVANYVHAKTIVVTRGSVSGVEVSDVATGNQLFVKAETVVNAAGPWVSEVASSLSPAIPLGNSVPLTKSMNLVLKKKVSKLAIGVSSQVESDAKIGSNNRLYFLVPWYERSIAGTTHFPHNNTTGQQSQPDQQEIDEFLTQLSTAMPTQNFTKDDVLYAYQGLTPAVAEGNAVKRPEHSIVIDHKSSDGVANFFSIVGIKWTTARLVAEEAVNLVCVALNRGSACVTRSEVIPALTQISNSTVNLDSDGLEKFCKSHIEHTSALDLADIVLRRTDDLVCGRMDNCTFHKIASIVRREFNWNETQLLEAIDRLLHSGLPADRVSNLKSEITK